MKLIAVPLELTKEVMKEVTEETVAKAVKETAVTAEELTEFGKIGNEIEPEHIVSMGKLGIGDGESQLTFYSDSDDFFCNEHVEPQIDTDGENSMGLDNDLKTGDISKHDVLLEPQVAFRGGLSACSYKCIQSYCYPVNIAKGIGTQKPHQPNSKMGHT